MNPKQLTAGVLIDVVFIGRDGRISDGWVPLSEVVSAERIRFTVAQSPELAPLAESRACAAAGVVVSDGMSWDEEVAADYKTYGDARGSLRWLKYNDYQTWCRKGLEWEGARDRWTMELQLRGGRRAYVSDRDGFALRDLFGIRDLMPEQPPVWLA